MQRVTIIGGGLAGSEAAYQLAQRNISVTLHEMRPLTSTPAHMTGDLGELVCSNSLRAKKPTNAPGVLKEELRIMDSLIMRAADHAQIPAGGALAVDRQAFSRFISETIESMEMIDIVRGEVTTIPSGPVIIASGPLSSAALSSAIQEFLNDDALHFFDAVAPIITKDSINMDTCYIKDRYGETGEGDYINCPMDEAQYTAFYNYMMKGEGVTLREFEKNVFEGCMPVESMASRGKDTLRYGPLKPVGLARDEAHKPHAVVQLRKDDARDTMVNIVGFQTQLKFGEQKRLIRMIPGLENAEIVRYGVMHKNSFIKAPAHLHATYRSKTREDVFFAGQLSGVEGYIESTGSGIVAALNMAAHMRGKDSLIFPPNTIMGAQADYLATANQEQFQPMNANFGLLPPLEGKHRKKERKKLYGERAIESMKTFKKDVVDYV